MRINLTRWQAIKVAWTLFWMATGTSSIQIQVNEEGRSLSFLGKDLHDTEYIDRKDVRGA